MRDYTPTRKRQSSFQWMTPKRILAASLIAASLALGTISTPFIKTAYKKHQASSLIERTSQSLSSVQQSIIDTQKVLDSNSSILTDKEKAKFEAEIDDSKRNAGESNYVLSVNKGLFESGNYDEVRRKLDEHFDLKEGASRVTSLTILAKENDDLRRIKEFCNTKKTNRDIVMMQEGELIARLASPIPAGMTERKEKHNLLSSEQYAWIPISSPNLESKLTSLGAKELRNSLGVMLVNNEPILNHIIENALRDSVKQNAKDIYDNAKANYLKVMPLNDSLIKYRANIHDGKFSMDDYTSLLQAQRVPLNLINTGDSLISKLQQYNQEFHNQYYSFVSDQKKTDTTFHHTRTVPKTRLVTRSDSKGRTHTHLETYLASETYHTYGHKFFYVQTTISPGQRKDEDIYVGQIDGSGSWNYRPQEQVGYLIAWKRFHDDNSGIISGGSIKQINPFIDKEQEKLPAEAPLKH